MEGVCDEKVQLQDVRLFESTIRSLVVDGCTVQTRFCGLFAVMVLVSALHTWLERRILALQALRIYHSYVLYVYNATNADAVPLVLPYGLGELPLRQTQQLDGLTQHVDTHAALLLYRMALWLCTAVLPPTLFICGGVFRATITEPSFFVHKLNRSLSCFHVAYSAPRARLMRIEKAVQTRTWNENLRFRAHLKSSPFSPGERRRSAPGSQQSGSAAGLP
ncbi:hypothetical protein FVE85_7354 [Porphyridium purpureum]|uniref:Uncharacterized protein n=1 Tax=Porphyridium purpureum TaxID=35688 RepID=A0A5J4Z6X9_PORPP|nr:hypothetical protein FVE85_7354 [Porphyridium purpureum]|eukprot:POR0569..scf295_1